MELERWEDSDSRLNYQAETLHKMESEQRILIEKLTNNEIWRHCQIKFKINKEECKRHRLRKAQDRVPYFKCFQMKSTSRTSLRSDLLSAEAAAMPNPGNLRKSRVSSVWLIEKYRMAEQSLISRLPEVWASSVSSRMWDLTQTAAHRSLLSKSRN